MTLDACESHAQNYTEIEMSTYDPVLRHNVKLPTTFAPKPGENSDNIKIVQSFDTAVNCALPAVAPE